MVRGPVRLLLHPQEAILVTTMLLRYVYGAKAPGHSPVSSNLLSPAITAPHKTDRPRLDSFPRYSHTRPRERRDLGTLTSNQVSPENRTLICGRSGPLPSTPLQVRFLLTSPYLFISALLYSRDHCVHTKDPNGVPRRLHCPQRVPSPLVRLPLRRQRRWLTMPQRCGGAHLGLSAQHERSAGCRLRRLTKEHVPGRVGRGGSAGALQRGERRRGRVREQRDDARREPLPRH